MQNTIIRSLVATLAACLVGGIAFAQQPDTHVTLRVEGRTLAEVVQYLRDESGANIVVLGGGEAEISLELNDVSWREALELACELAGCVVDERGGGVLTVEKPERVTFKFKDQNIREVIDTIATLGSANIVVAPEVDGTLSLNLTDVPWRDALDVAVKTLGYTVVQENRGVLRVVDPLSLQAQMETQYYVFRFLRPDNLYQPVLESEFAVGGATKVSKGAGGSGSASQLAEKKFPVIESFRKALSKGGDLNYVPATNGMIVRDTAQVHAEIQAIMSKLDVEPGQVFVDVKFVSTTNEDIFNLGVDYGDSGPQVGFSMGQIPISLPFDLGPGGWDDLIIASPDGKGPYVGPGNGGNTLIPDTVFGALSFTGINATIRALQRDSRTEIVQAPQLIAIDGQAATIFVGETIRYAEAKTEQGQAGGLQLSISEADNSPVDVGFQLLVVPHIVPGTNKLSMEVIPKETSLSGQGNSAIAPPGFDIFTIGASGLEGQIALPRKRSSTIVTSMILESGQPVMIGGLATDTEIEQHTEVPFLADIPWLGELFQHDSKTAARRSLMVFITPTIVRTASDQQRLLERELRQRRSEFGDRLREILYGDEAAMAKGAQMGADPVEMTGE
jgi:type II secretory pathway component GspD/PulD (secretin)